MIQRSHNLPPQTIHDWRHYRAVIQRKPGALRNGAPFLELPHTFRQLQDNMLRKPGGDREMLDILALVLHHGDQGKSVIVVSSEFEEILAVADRVLVMRDGKCVAERRANATSEHDLLLLAGGQGRAEAMQDIEIHQSKGGNSR